MMRFTEEYTEKGYGLRFWGRCGEHGVIRALLAVRLFMVRWFVVGVLVSDVYLSPLGALVP
jgi:hypothetical protein